MYDILCIVRSASLCASNSHTFTISVELTIKRRVVRMAYAADDDDNEYVIIIAIAIDAQMHRCVWQRRRLWLL